MSERDNQIEAINYYFSETFHKTNSFNSFFYFDAFIERMKCDNKESLIKTIKILMDMVSSIRNYGYLSLQNYADKLTNPVANHIIKLITSNNIPPINVLREILLCLIY